MPIQQNKVELAVSRKEGKGMLEFVVPEVVRNIWKARELPVAESRAWPGLKFYKLANEDRVAGYTDMLEQHGLFDDFGSELVDAHGRFNVAFLRTVEGTGEIPLNGDLSYATVVDKVRNLAAFVREFVEGYVADYRITGSVLIEV